MSILCGCNNGYSCGDPSSGGWVVIEMDFRGIKAREKDLYSFILCEKVILTFILVQVSATSSSGILSGTLVEFGWAGEGQGSGFPRGREGEEDHCLKLILSTQTVENNKVTYTDHLDFIAVPNCI